MNENKRFGGKCPLNAPLLGLAGWLGTRQANGQGWVMGMR